MVTAKGGVVEVRGDGVYYLRPSHHRPDREPVPQSLSHRDEVRLHVEGFDPPEVAAGAPEGGLHLVGDQEYAGLVQDLLYPLEVSRRRLDKPADTLYRLRD